MNLTKRVTSLLIVSLVAAWGRVSFADFNGSSIQKKLSSIKAADHAVIFSRVRDGKVLFESNADALLSPASATKVLTSAAALAYFGPAFTFTTPILYSGTLERQRLRGDLYVQGNGDPFLVSEVLWQTAIDLRHLGIREITGNVIIDNTLFDSETRDESRLEGTQQSIHAYDAPVSAFAVNFNTVAVAFAPTTKGKAAISEVTPFPLKNVRLSSRAMTISGDNSAQVSVTRSSLPNGGVSLKGAGTIGASARLKKIYRSAADPTITSGDYLIGFLEKANIKVSVKVRAGKTPSNAKLLYEINGFEMRRIVQGLNTFSNNFIADMLTKRLGAAFGDESKADSTGSGSLKFGVKVLSDFLRGDVGVKSDFKLFNGSGLSTENRLSARQLLTVLNYMESRGELFPDFLASLPANGWDGTLRKRMSRDDGMAGQIHAKSGTLTEPITVASLAGYFRHPKEGWVSFVMIGNGREGKGQPGLQDLRSLQDDVLKGIFSN
jgi:D-alanyl-D-alanine carboxypeptidase/D-alanyl-D-alanine-endopeptidase (penicillin-binding protein 4)